MCHSQSTRVLAPQSWLLGAMFALIAACSSTTEDADDDQTNPTNDTQADAATSPTSRESTEATTDDTDATSTSTSTAQADDADSTSTNDDSSEVTDGSDATGPDVTMPVNEDWFKQNTVSLRVDLPLAYRGQVLNAQVLAEQLAGYDPGSLLRCAVADDNDYREAIDTLGGVSWGYAIGALEDQSKPRIYAGYQRQYQLDPVPAAAGDAASGGAVVEIVKPDIVAVTESAALFYSSVHGLLLVSLEGDEPEFKCAAQLPGNVNQFFFHEGHLVAMTKSLAGTESALVHFDVTGSEVEFVEKVSLGNVNILDSRRFNDRLVFYTSMTEPAVAIAQPSNPSGIGGLVPPVYVQPSNNRALHVYRLGETLEREMYDTLLDTSISQDQLLGSVTAETPPGTIVNEANWYGANIWASDHYFVVTEQVTKTTVDSWRTELYSVCSQSHTTETPYDYCWTEYEDQPNPDYVEPDNSGGDRSCKGVTLSECLIQVAKVANKTIRVPVEHKCEKRIRYNWFCDAYEQRTAEYPVYRYAENTRLYIYEYTDEGFIQVDAQVHEVTNTELAATDPNDTVDTVNTSTETFDLSVPGSVQTLYFQNGYLYVISQGVLQVYAMGGSSIVRTSTLDVVNESLQSSLFTSEQLFLSDFGYSTTGDHSTLRVVDLTNPAFPSVEGATHELPGGHRSILATSQGIFTIGTVQQFMGETVNALKLGLFTNPYAEETAYLILGTDLVNTYLSTEEAQYFDATAERLLLPYTGSDENQEPVFRVGVSRLEPGTIETEGAVMLPESAERVRRLPFENPSYLSFAANSIEWLTPADDEWQTEPVLEYMSPSYVYRLNDDSDYVEVQRLGSRCRLYFANAADINQREDGKYSEEFVCKGSPVAYANTLVFQQGSVEFGADHAIRLLTDDEVKAVQELIAARPICILSEDVVDNIYVNPNTVPDDSEVTCMSAQEYYERSRELGSQ